MLHYWQLTSERGSIVVYVVLRSKLLIASNLFRNLAWVVPEMPIMSDMAALR